MRAPPPKPHPIEIGHTNMLNASHLVCACLLGHVANRALATMWTLADLVFPPCLHAHSRCHQGTTLHHVLQAGQKHVQAPSQKAKVTKKPQDAARPKRAYTNYARYRGAMLQAIMVALLSPLTPSMVTEVLNNASEAFVAASLRRQRCTQRAIPGQRCLAAYGVAGRNGGCATQRPQKKAK